MEIGSRAQPLMNFDLNSLPLSPKRLAKAAATAGWKWNSSFASGRDENHMVDSIVVRCASGDQKIVARWESVDGGKLALAVAWHYVGKGWPVRLNFNEAVALVASNPV